MIVEVEGAPPTRATPGSAGGDLRARHFHTFPPGTRHKVKTGVRVAIPHGYVGLVIARSSLCDRVGLKLANAVGVIDSDFRGEILLNLENVTDHDVKVSSGDRLAQLIIVPCYMDAFIEADLDETSRGDGGFGSTGTN